MDTTFYILKGEADDGAVDELNRLLNEGHTVLVHCRHGKSRSPHVIAACLASRENKQYQDVYEEIRKICPRVLWLSMGEEIKNKFGVEWE